MQIEITPTHYIIEGKSYVRVTELLRERELVDFSKIPAVDRDFYMQRGKGIHKLFEDIEKGVDGGFTYDPRVEEYRLAHTNFMRDTGFFAVPGGIEMTVFNDDLGIAGTLDRLGVIQGRLTLLDYKTTAVPHSTALQTALYAHCLPQFKFNEIERYGVAFCKKGKYLMSSKYPQSDYNDSLWHVQEYWKSKGGVPCKN